MNISQDIFYIGVNDHDIDLFEGQYVVPDGMAYNSYAIMDEKVAVMDGVDARFADEWLSNLDAVLQGRDVDYLVIQHMEPDHSGGIKAFLETHPQTQLMASAAAFMMLKRYVGEVAPEKLIAVKEGDTLELGRHTLSFVGASMVHWPEVIMTYDSADRVLFSADGFGKFGALDVEADWACEARRYYFGIVGKFGKNVQAVLKKAANLDIQTICPLHGPVLTENLGYYLDLYNTWSSYGVESEGITIAYSTVYGHMKEAVELLATRLEELGCPKVAVSDVSRDDQAEIVEDAFRYGTLVLATTTYNNGIFPTMHTFIDHLVDHAFQNRKVAFMEGGTWAPSAAKHMKAALEGCANMDFAKNAVTVLGALNDESRAQVEALAKELMA